MGLLFTERVTAFGSMVLAQFNAGGPVMIPLLVLGCLGVGITLERIWALYVTFPIDVDPFFVTLRQAVATQPFEEIAASLGTSPKPLHRLVHSVFIQAATWTSSSSSSAKPLQVESTIEGSLLSSVPPLEARIGFLNVFANVATLLGLLGTLSGLIRSFAAVAQSDTANKAAALTQGISESMHCTAFGLLIAIFCSLAYAALAYQSHRQMRELEQASYLLLSMLHDVRRLPPYESALQLNAATSSEEQAA